MVTGVIGMIAYDGYLEWRLDSYDTNGDGVFSPDEQSLGQSEAMDGVVNGLGRTVFVTVSWPLISLIHFGVLYVSTKVSRRHASLTNA